MSQLLSPLQEILWSPASIRARCQQVFEKARNNKLTTYTFHPEKVDEMVDFVIEIIKQNYPNGDIPPHSRWRHFEVGGIDRWRELDLPADTREQARVATELTITSVLLDAGAGATWQFIEPSSGQTLSRSEGLGVASFLLFSSGTFSDRPNTPLRADGKALQSFSIEQFNHAFQVRDDNPIIGADARVTLLQKLGDAVCSDEDYFPDARLGGLIDTLYQNAHIDVSHVFRILLHAFATIWPERISSYQLGDVWHYEGISGEPGSENLLPFHKLTQWMAYSLIDAWRMCGIEVIGDDVLTALPEYRNGGLLLDFGVIAPRGPGFEDTEFSPDHAAVIEMRAMTIAVLDIAAEKIRTKLNKDKSQLSLAQILEGGTWSAGRAIAKQRRPNAVPPIKYTADGTLF